MVLTPHDNDVLLGRGTTINSHPGNLRLRALVSEQKETYSKAGTKQIKREIAMGIVDHIQSLTPPGRFLIDSSGGKGGVHSKESSWIRVEPEKAIEKVLHRLREKEKPSGGASGGGDGSGNGGKKTGSAKKQSKGPRRRSTNSSMGSLDNPTQEVSNLTVGGMMMPQIMMGRTFESDHSASMQRRRSCDSVASSVNSASFHQRRRASADSSLQTNNSTAQWRLSGNIAGNPSPCPNIASLQFPSMGELQQFNQMRMQSTGGNSVASTPLPTFATSNPNVGGNNMGRRASTQSIYSLPIQSHATIHRQLSVEMAGNPSPTAQSQTCITNLSVLQANNNNFSHQPHQQAFGEPLSSIPGSDLANQGDIRQYASEQFQLAMQQLNTVNASAKDSSGMNDMQQPVLNNCNQQAGWAPVNNVGYPQMTLHDQPNMSIVQYNVQPNQANNNVGSGDSIFSPESGGINSQNETPMAHNQAAMPLACPNVEALGMTHQPNFNSNYHFINQANNQNILLKAARTPPLSIVENTERASVSPPNNVNKELNKKPHPESNTCMKQPYDEAKFSTLGEDDEIEMDNDLRTFFSRQLENSNDSDFSRAFQQTPLRQWMEVSNNNHNDGSNSDFSTSPVSNYVKAALMVALKLAEYLADEEESVKKGFQNQTPLASISTDNVLVYTCPSNPLQKFSDSHQLPLSGHAITQGFDWDESSEEKRLSQNDSDTDHIDLFDEQPLIRVEIFRRDGDDSAVGGNDSRLFALGSIFYELFSQGSLSLDRSAMGNGEKSVGGLNLDSDSSSCAPRSKKSAQPSIMNGKAQQESISKLLLLGLPQSICSVVYNLLDCNQGDFRGDDAYKTFADVRSDLQHMIDDPLRFVHNSQAGEGTSLQISDKLYGRDSHIALIKQAYCQLSQGACSGVLISGEGGVGKSKLCNETVKNLTNGCNGHFLQCKFDENHNIKPLSVIGSVFNELCNVFSKDVHSYQDGQRLEAALQFSLGSQVGLLADILPNLSKLMPVHSDYGSSSHFVDSAMSVRFLFSALLQTLSSHFSKSVTIVFDDIHWADTTSLQLLSCLVHHFVGNEHVFFAFCCRSENLQERQDSPLNQWFASVSELPLVKIEVQNLESEWVGKLVSDSLCLTPRLTRSLSAVLFSKTLGNPLFVRKMLESLKEERCLQFSLKDTDRRWRWDLEKIFDLEIADNVIALLTRKMDKQPTELQQGLQVASCMGASVSKAVVNILSTHLGIDLQKILCEATRKGYMDLVGSNVFRFVHNKVRQAAYEMIPENQRRNHHMSFGLAICSNALSNNDNEMFFVSVNQINRGGVEALVDIHQSSMIASLNLKAGTKATAFSDHASALGFFRSGMEFLVDETSWDNHYELSVNIFSAAAAAACELNDSESVIAYSDQILKRAKSLEHKLNAMYIIVKSLRRSMNFSESKKYSFSLLEMLGEELPRSAGDNQLFADIRKMHGIISGLSDETILNMEQTHEERLVLVMKVYHELLLLLNSIEPNLMFSVCLRMVQLSLDLGLTEISPLAFAHFGVVLLEIGDPGQGYRLGSLSLRLAKKLNATGQISMIIGVVQQYIAWVSEPMQSIAESHLFGHNAGKQSGDTSSSMMNYTFYIMTSFYSGKNLETVRKNSCDFVQQLLRDKNQKWFVNGISLIHLQASALMEGPDVNVTECTNDNVPSAHKIIGSAAERNQNNLVKGAGIYQVMRAFYFRQYDDMSRAGDVLNNIVKEFTPLRVNYLIGVFYEGLVSYCMARRTKQEEWATKGNNALSFMQRWEKSSSWNFENKRLLLEAEQMFLQENSERASELYVRSIASAKEHKFIHEEAIAHELAGFFYHEKNEEVKALASFNEAVRCYESWGAKALVKRVKDFVEANVSTTQPMMLNPTDVEAFLKNNLEADSFTSRLPSINQPRLPYESGTQESSKRRFEFSN